MDNFKTWAVSPVNIFVGLAAFVIGVSALVILLPFFVLSWVYIRWGFDSDKGRGILTRDLNLSINCILIPSVIRDIRPDIRIPDPLAATGYGMRLHNMFVIFFNQIDKTRYLDPDFSLASLDISAYWQYIHGLQHLMDAAFLMIFANILQYNVTIVCIAAVIFVVQFCRLFTKGQFSRRREISLLLPAIIWSPIIMIICSGFASITVYGIFGIIPGVSVYFTDKLMATPFQNIMEQ